MTPIIAKTSITILALGAGCSAAAVKGDIYGERTWHKYVRSPNTSIVKPKGILAANITGNVCNPKGYLENNDAPTILTCKPDDLDIPSIVVDFGQNVVGVVSIDFGQSTNSSQGLPGLKFAFRETQQFLTNTSDFTRSDNLPDGQKIITGSDQIAVANEPATWKNNASCQYGEQVCSDGLHGFRYMKIWLGALESDAPYTQPYGSVSISNIEPEWSDFLGTPDTFTG